MSFLGNSETGDHQIRRDYTLGRTLGINGDSKVKIGTDSQGVQAALKIFDCSYMPTIERTMQLYTAEAEALSQLPFHPNVVRFLKSS